MTPRVGIIGHRGWPGRFPDNTLAAFLAVSSLVDGVELDVRRSLDGKLVVSHEPILDGHAVMSTPWSILSEIDLGEGHHPALLDEVLSVLSSLPAQIEIKNAQGLPGYESDHRLALEAADRARPFDIITSFNRESVEAVRREYPDLSTGVILGRDSDFTSGVSLCFDAGHTHLVPHHSLLSNLEPTVWDGIAVTPWTVNDPERAGELVAMGVSAIITDDPTAILGAWSDR